MATKQPLPRLTYMVNGDAAVAAVDLVTDRWSEPAVGLHDSRLDYDAALRLRNWLSDWLGHHTTDANRVIKWRNLRQG